MKLNIKRAQGRRLTEEISEQLVSLIVNGNLKKWDKLPPERELMKQFGVGRGTVRQAIGSLSLMGVLVVRPGSGTYVTVTKEELLAHPLSWGTPVGRHMVQELMEARHFLETVIVELAAQRAREDDITEMRHCLTQMKAIKGNVNSMMTYDMSFHAALARASRNTQLFSFFLQIRNSLLGLGEQVLSIPSVYEKAVEGHAKILSAIEAHDVEGAKTELSNHLDFVEATLSSLMVSRKRHVTNPFHRYATQH